MNRAKEKESGPLTLEIKYDETKCVLTIRDVEASSFVLPISISKETLMRLGLEASCEFIGQRIVGLLPSLRELFYDEFPGIIEDKS